MISQRFEKCVEYEPNSGCWLWTGTIVESGYGRIKVNGKNIRAHRLSYELHKGPIPDGMLVCHTCDVPSCVNPDHLWLGTVQDNTRDMVAKGRNVDRKGVKHPLAKMSEKDVVAIRADTRSQTKIANDYGVSRSQIGRIKRKQKWGHV